MIKSLSLGIILFLFASVAYSLPTKPFTSLTVEMPTTRVGGAVLAATEVQSVVMYCTDSVGALTNPKTILTNGAASITVTNTDVIANCGTGLGTEDFLVTFTVKDTLGMESGISDVVRVVGKSGSEYAVNVTKGENLPPSQSNIIINR